MGYALHGQSATISFNLACSHMGAFPKSRLNSSLAAASSIPTRCFQSSFVREELPTDGADGYCPEK
jgi:hypothetical protein